MDLQVAQDQIADKLDEMADLSEHWKRWRERGHDPQGIRAGMVLLCGEIHSLERQFDRILGIKPKA